MVFNNVNLSNGYTSHDSYWFEFIPNKNDIMWFLNISMDKYILKFLCKIWYSKLNLGKVITIKIGHNIVITQRINVLILIEYNLWRHMVTMTSLFSFHLLHSVFNFDIVYNYNQTKKKIRNSDMQRIIFNEVHGGNLFTFE